MILLPETANTDVNCYGGGYWPLAAGPWARLLFMFLFIIIKMCVQESPAAKFRLMCLENCSGKLPVLN